VGPTINKKTPSINFHISHFFHWRMYPTIHQRLVRLAYQPPANSIFSQNKPATSNQPAILFSQNKPAPAISHQPTEQAAKS
jgi:hypothetical protein